MRAAAVTAVVIVAAVLRVLAARGDLWLDEIWTLRLLQGVRSPWDVFAIHHDNNHLLNSLYLYLLGERDRELWYRAVAVASGIGTVALLGYAPVRRDFPAAFTTCLLAAVSYPLVLFSSEARGYAPALFFAVASYHLLQAWWRRRTLARLLLFWAAALLGLLSHLTFAYVALALFVWSCVRETARPGRTPRALVELLRCHGVPLLFTGLLYVFFARGMVFGRGPVYDAFQVVRGALLLATGAHGGEVVAALGVLAAFAASLAGLVALERRGSDAWVFLLAVLVHAPACILLLATPTYFYDRYLLACFPFFYILAGHALAAAWRGAWPGKALFAVVLLLFVAGNAPRIAALLALGRGGYHAALLYMAEHTAGGEISVASDNDTRNEKLVWFYQRRLPEGKRIVYHDHEHLPEGGPEWLITHSQDLEAVPQDTLRVQGSRYTLARSYRYSGISGWHWFLYHKDAGARR